MVDWKLISQYLNGSLRKKNAFYWERHSLDIYGISVDYNRSSPNCQCSDYCRCSIITDIKIESSLQEITQNILKFFYNRIPSRGKYKISLTDMEKYFLNKLTYALAQHSEKEDLINVCGVGGYYGEELSVTINESFLKKVTTVLESLPQKSSDFDLICKLLEMEYGYLLDRVKECSSVYFNKNVPIDSINLPNKEYFIKLNSNILDSFTAEFFETEIAGVCIGNNLIDGYHRMVAAKKLDVKTVNVLVLK